MGFILVRRASGRALDVVRNALARQREALDAGRIMEGGAEEGVCEDVGVALRRVGRAVELNAGAIADEDSSARGTLRHNLDHLIEDVGNLPQVCMFGRETPISLLEDALLVLREAVTDGDESEIRERGRELADNVEEWFNLPERNPVICFVATDESDLEEELNIEIASREEAPVGIVGSLEAAKACVLFNRDDEQ